jgi:hypothetical protein
LQPYAAYKTTTTLFKRKSSKTELTRPLPRERDSRRTSASLGECSACLHRLFQHSSLSLLSLSALLLQPTRLSSASKLRKTDAQRPSELRLIDACSATEHSYILAIIARSNLNHPLYSASVPPHPIPSFNPDRESRIRWYSNTRIAFRDH